MNTGDIQTHLEQVRVRIIAAACSAERKPDDVCLIAVSKTFPPAVIEQAIMAGQRVFGENRVQEAQEKWPDLHSAYPGLELHLLGPLQTNKVAVAVELFDAIHSLDREKLAKKLATVMEKTGRTPRLYIQINTGEEEKKAGVFPKHADEFITFCRYEIGLDIAGLMSIPPLDDPPGLHFALLSEMAARHGLRYLSMGMSGDFETAIRFGATHIRLGSAIFGARSSDPVLPKHHDAIMNKTGC